MTKTGLCEALVFSPKASVSHRIGDPPTSTKTITGSMSALNRTLVGLTVVAFGAVAAIPFRRTPPPASGRSLVDRGSVVWRQTDSLVEGTKAPLVVPPVDGQRRAEPASGALTDPDSRPERNEPIPTKPSKMSIMFEELDDSPPTAPIANPPPQMKQVELRLVKPRPSRSRQVVPVDTPANPEVQQPERPRTSGQIYERQHRIIDGDTLEKLATRYLGDPHRWREIFKANRDQLRHPELLPIGVTLKILRRREHP